MGTCFQSPDLEISTNEEINDQLNLHQECDRMVNKVLLLTASSGDQTQLFFKQLNCIYNQHLRDDTEKAAENGIIEHHYLINNSHLQFMSVDGQRNKRQKWIHLFEGISGILYLADLTAFNQRLHEDQSINAMHESIELFTEISNSRLFRKTEMIILLTKNDIFRAMLRDGHSLRSCFNIDHGWGGIQWDNDDFVDYESKENDQHFENYYENAIQFIRDQYSSRSRNPYKVIYVHVVTMTDKESMEMTMWDISNILIRSNLRGGLLGGGRMVS